MRSFLSIILLSFLQGIIYPMFAQYTVSNSSELQNLLRQDKYVGTIFLNADLFELEQVDVKAGGIIMPARGRKPVVIGRNVFLERAKAQEKDNGYWRIKLDDFKAKDFWVLDGALNNVSVSSLVNGQINIRVKSEDVVKTDKEKSIIKIRIPDSCPSLKNHSKSFLKNCILKMTYWYQSFEVVDLWSDNEFVYGRVSAGSYVYNNIGNHYKFDSYLTFFNYPENSGGVYVDGNGYVNVPEKYSCIRICTSENILQFNTNNNTTISGLTFKGSATPVRLGQGTKKTIRNCVFENCRTGIDAFRGLKNRNVAMTISDCTFKNMYNNTCINALGCDSVIISGNKTNNTGIFNKGDAVIAVGGNGYDVNNNIIECFSYIGIMTGLHGSHEPITINGTIHDNVVDNYSNYGDPSTQLIDGGGIYVSTHNDSTVVRDNIIRNIGFAHSSERGIYLDDGAYNTHVINNLVYNIYPGEKAIFARLVDDFSRHGINNEFIGNICVGDCVMYGHKGDLGRKAIIKDNYIDGNLDTDQSLNAVFEGNVNIKTKVLSSGKLSVDRSVKIPKTRYSKKVRKSFRNWQRLER